MSSVVAARVRLLSSFVGLAVAAGPIVGCAPGKRGTKNPGNLPSVADETGQTKCKVNASSNKPLVVEWPAADRTQVEAGARRGIVAVRYVGCEMELLPACVLPGTYGYVATTAKRENVKVTSADELYAHMPVGALKLEAELQREGELNVDMMIVGRKDADKVDFTSADLGNQCARATHVVSGLTVGAFEFYAGRGVKAGAGVEVGNIGAGGSTARDRSLLSSDGDIGSCTVATANDAAPPGQCGALLRLEVVPIAITGGSGGGGGDAPIVTPPSGGGAPIDNGVGNPVISRGKINDTIRNDAELYRRYRRAKSIITGGSVMTGVGGLGLIVAGGIAGVGGGIDGEAAAAIFGLFGGSAIVGVALLAAGLPMRNKVRRDAESRARGVARLRVMPAAGGITLRF